MKITPEIKEQINVLYLQIGTYAGVAREIGCAPSTVKNHIIPGFKPQEQMDIERFDFSSFKRLSVEEIVEVFDARICDLVVPSEEEIIELKDLQDREVSI